MEDKRNQPVPNCQCTWCQVRKKEILLKHYSFDEICEIMGYDDESNTEVANSGIQFIEKHNYPLFVEVIMNAAIINGNFEDVIKDDVRMPI